MNGELAAHGIRVGQGVDTAAVRRDTEKSVTRREDDVVVVAPAAAANCRGVGNHDRCATRKGHLLELRIFAEKGDPFSVGGKEGRGRVFCSRKHLHVELIQTSNVEPSSLTCAPDVCEPSPVR